MPQNLDLEQLVITRFFAPRTQDRYRGFVASAKNRPKLIADLHSGSFFRADALERVTGSEEDVIQQALRQHGIPSSSCYVISDNAALDTHTLPLQEALHRVVGWGAATILVFGEAELIFVEMEGLRNRFISKSRVVGR